MEDTNTQSSTRGVPIPEKKISNKQLEILKSVLGESLTDTHIKSLIDSGDLVGRKRTTTRRGWVMKNGNKVFPSLSFKGLQGSSPTDEMEKFREMYIPHERIARRKKRSSSQMS